jgi:hypothetical protein
MDRDGELPSEALAIEEDGILSTRSVQMTESAVAYMGSAPKKLGDGKAARDLLLRADTTSQAANRS